MEKALLFKQARLEIEHSSLIGPYVCPLYVASCAFRYSHMPFYLANVENKYMYCIAGNVRMVQIFAYFEHVQIVRKLEPTKNFTLDYEVA